MKFALHELPEGLQFADDFGGLLCEGCDFAWYEVEEDFAQAIFVEYLLVNIECHWDIPFSEFIYAKLSLRSLGGDVFNIHLMLSLRKRVRTSPTPTEDGGRRRDQSVGVEPRAIDFNKRDRRNRRDRARPC